jgi:small subunit ribosomal protein S6
MTLPAPTYDLMLLLDPQAEDSARAKVVSDAARAIESDGQLVRQDDWGERPLAYPIDRKTSAEYHLLQFHVSQTSLLEGLDRTLRITDGVLRHRIVKLAPGTPEPPSAGAPRPEPVEQPAAAAHPAAEPEPPAAAEQPAAVEPEASAAAEQSAAAEPDAPATAGQSPAPETPVEPEPEPPAAPEPAA